MIVDTTELVVFFKVPSDKILLMGTKILLNIESNEEATNIINSLQLSEVDMNDDLQNTVIRETLFNFNQILTLTTIYIWEHHSEATKQNTAALNLKSKMRMLETINASEATALALTKATELINNDKALSLNTNLRLSNLEKSMRRQEQKYFELHNKNKNNKSQKNSSGSHLREPMASPDIQAPQKRKYQVVDLTLEPSGESPTRNHGNKTYQYSQLKQRNTKQQKRTRTQQENTKKSIQWKDAEIQDFNPKSPANLVLTPHGNHFPTPTRAPEMGSSPLFHPTNLQQTRFGQPSQNPFSNNPFSNNPYNQYQQTQGQTHGLFQTQQGNLQHPFQPTNARTQIPPLLFPQHQNYHPNYNPYGTPLPHHQN
jgi:hypothetical protein